MNRRDATISEIHKGDILYESEYGMTVEIEVLEEPIFNHQENYWTFPGRTQKRGIINFRGQIDGGAYNPDLYFASRDFFGDTSDCEWLEPLHTVKNKIEETIC